MPDNPRIGFVGFGEAGSNLAEGLHAAGVEALAAYDIKSNDSSFGPTIRSRAAETRTALVGSPQELAAQVDIILSVVTASAALEAATQILPFLKPHHLYADLNSVSP